MRKTSLALPCASRALRRLGHSALVAALLSSISALSAQTNFLNGISFGAFESFILPDGVDSALTYQASGGHYFDTYIAFQGSAGTIFGNVDGVTMYGSYHEIFGVGLALITPYSGGGGVELFPSGNSARTMGALGIGTSNLAYPHLELAYDGAQSSIKFGTGSIASDTTLTRTALGVLQLNGQPLITQSQLATYVPLLAGTGIQTIAKNTTFTGTSSLAATTLGGGSAGTQVKIDGTTGNVGIGTASPVATGPITTANPAKLDVAGAAWVNELYLSPTRTRGAGYGYPNVASGVGGRILFGSESGDYATIYSDITSTGLQTGLVLEVGDDPDDYIDFRKNSATSAPHSLMRLTVGGNLGIGTGPTAPLKKLHIAGSGASSQAIMLEDSSQTSGNSRWVTQLRTSPTPLYQIAPANSGGDALVAGFILDRVGNVGIGTTTLSGGTGNTLVEGKLQVFVSGTDATALMIKGNSAEHAGLKIKVGPGVNINTSNTSGAPDYYDFTVRPSYSAGVNTGADVSAIRINNTFPRSFPDVLLVKDGGKVGIGTGSSPVTEKLQVAGNVKVDGTISATSVTFPNGEVLASNKTTKLYNAAGTEAASVGTDGKVTFANGVTVGSSTLTPNSTAYLNQTLQNLGYKESAPPATDVSTITFNTGAISVYDMVRQGGSIYVAGSFNGSGVSIFQKSSYSSAGGSDAFVAKLDSSGVAQWVAVLGGRGNDYFYSLSVTSSGDVYVGGSFTDATTNLTGNLISAGASDGIVGKLNSSGVFQWTQAIGGTSSDKVNKIAVHPGGGVVAVGDYVSATTNLPANNLVAAGGYDGFVIRLDANGGQLWAKGIGSTEQDFVYSACVDSVGNIFAVGLTAGTITTLPELGAGLPNVAGWDALAVKFGPTGVASWAKIVGGASSDSFNTAVCDVSGNLYAAGSFYLATTNMPNGVPNLISVGDSDGMILRFEAATGVVAWAKGIGGIGNEQMSKLVWDSSANLVVGGSFSGAIDMPGSVADFNAPLSTQAIMILRYATNGNLLEATSVSGASRTDLTALDFSVADAFIAGNTAAENGASWVGDEALARGSFLLRWNGFSLSTPPAASAASFSWGGSKAASTGVALGNGAYAPGGNSAALGLASATGTGAFAAGTASATGLGATAAGLYSTASGSGSVAMGQNSIASGNYSVAFGMNARATGLQSFAVGSTQSGIAEASGSFSVAFGGYAIGNWSRSFGHNNEVTGTHGTAIGANNKVSSQYGTAIGLQNRVDSYDAFVVGRYNVAQGSNTWVPTDDLFVVANGSLDTARANALVVLKNGNTRIAGTVQAKGGFRTPKMGDIDMGEFTAGPNPADATTGLNAGLRYPSE